jgi:hypothetical protein
MSRLLESWPQSKGRNFATGSMDMTPQGNCQAGFHCLLDVGDGVVVGAGAGVTFHMSSRFFQVSPSRR